MDVKPTRTGLLRVKKRQSLASKGHDLLKHKYDALLYRFTTLLKEHKQRREALTDLFSKTLRSYVHLHARYGKPPPLKDSTVIVKTNHVLGMDVKQLQANTLPQGQSLTLYHHTFMTLRDDLQPQLLNLFNDLLVLRSLAREIERTNIKVNSLEKRVLPELDTHKKRITQALEQQEQELFSTLKRVKEQRERQ